ncbi:MAG: glucose-6-phosphate isomerase [Legionellales bacterium]|jgi:glucose-6-phosphate isomerase
MLLAPYIDILRSSHIRDLFAQDPMRASRMEISCHGLTLDFSHQRITEDIWNALVEYAKKNKLDQHIHDLISGAVVNVSENRPALHTALRDPSLTPIFVKKENIKPKIQSAFESMRTLCKTVWQSGITDVLILGIGGSYWGSLCVCEALRTLPKRLNVHFLGDMEAEAFEHATRNLRPEKTIVIVISKSFKTIETLSNAKRARTWLGPLLAAHAIAVTANIQEAQSFGIQASHILPMWSWVGGRYSLWSCVGIPIALCYGIAAFQELLHGAHLIDQHLQDTPLKQNLPVMAALITFLNTRILDASTEAIIPYSARMRHFIPYVQQLKMESLGKSRNVQGQKISEPTGPVIWGQTGLHAQHTFNQILHQGNQCIPIDFILSNDIPELVNSCLAQSQALAFGDPHHEVLHARSEGNQPHNILKLNTLNPETLGMLMAFYEHKTYLLACLFNINAFDQFGVELAKKILVQTESL